MKQFEKYVAELKTEFRIKFNLLIGNMKKNRAFNSDSIAFKDNGKDVDTENKKFSLPQFELLKDDIESTLERLKEENRSKGFPNEVVTKINPRISISLLKSILLYKWKPNPEDDRSINTLKLISLYLKYESWEHFLNSKNKSKVENNEIQQEKIKVHFFEAMEKMRNAYASLPNVDFKDLENYFRVNGEVYTHLHEELNRLIKKNVVLGEHAKKHAPSIFGQDFFVIDVIQTMAIVLVREYWGTHIELPEKCPYPRDKYHRVLYDLSYENNRWKVVRRMITIYSMHKYIDIDEEDL